MGTHINILQIQEVKNDAVSFPDDWRPQRALNGTREDCAQAHCYRGDA